MKNYKNFIEKKTLNINIPLPKDIIDIFNAYNKAGKKLYVVGGAIRDFLLGKQPHDYDLTTNALPEESKEILKNFNVSDEQGANFGVLRVYTEDEPLGHEIATFRKDISKGRDTKGDDKKVEIGKDVTIEDDCMRRDITINALFYDIEKQEIVDLVGGINDLNNNIIRSVGEPQERFNEDRLRILRVFRFAARTGGKVDFVTAKAIKKDNRLRGISPEDDVSQERILEEWNKTMEHAEKGGIIVMQRFIDLLSEFNMWQQMFPKLKVNEKVKIHTLNNAIIFFDLFKNNDFNGLKKYLVQDLKFGIKDVNYLIFFKEYMKSDNVYRLATLKNRFNIDEEVLTEFVKIHKLNKGFLKAFLKYCNDGFVINGNDLIAKGFKGKDIAIEKERLEIERFKNDYLK